MDITGASAVVTGGASGLGLATVRAAARGRRVGDDPRPAVLRRATRWPTSSVTAPVRPGRRHRRGRGRRRPRRRRRAGAAARRGELRRHRRRDPHPRARRASIRSTSSPGSSQINLIGTFNVHPAGGGADGRARAGRDDGAGRDRQHRLGRRLRRADRPGRLLGVEGRRRRHDAADRPRPRRRR